jgi:hypothetical protein
MLTVTRSVHLLSLGAVLLAAVLRSESAAQQPAPGSRAPWATPALSHVPMPTWLSVSGEVRTRLESRSGLGYRSDVSDSYGLVRTRINVDLRPVRLVRVSLQGQDARAPGMTGTASGVFRDPFDVRQAFVRVAAPEAAPIAIIVGRQLLSFADQRLIGALDWTNTSRAFDAAKMELRTRWADLDLWAASVVKNDPERTFNRSDVDDGFHGAYARIRTGTDRLVLEPFAFWRAYAAAGPAPAGDRYSAGVRVVGHVRRLETALVVVEQWGERGTDDIAARAVLASAAYPFAAPWSPRLYAEYNYASGDGTPGDGTLESFDDMYPTAHLYYGYNDMVGLRNLHNVRVGASVVPWRRLNLALDVHTFRLATPSDHLYNAAGVATVMVPSGGAVDSGVGTEVDASFTLPVAQTLTLSGGVGRLFAGPFLEAHSPGADNTFVHAAAAVRF